MTHYLRIAGIMLFMALYAGSVQAQNKLVPKNAPAQPKNPPSQAGEEAQTAVLRDLQRDGPGA